MALNTSKNIGKQWRSGGNALLEWKIGVRHATVVPGNTRVGEGKNPLTGTTRSFQVLA